MCLLTSQCSARQSGENFADPREDQVKKKPSPNQQLFVSAHFPRKRQPYNEINDVTLFASTKIDGIFTIMFCPHHHALAEYPSGPGFFLSRDGIRL